MKALRILIVSFIVVTAGCFIIFTAGSDAETILFNHIHEFEQHHIYLILLISALILLSTLSGLPIFYFSVALGFLLPFVPAMLISYIINLLAVLSTFYIVRYTFYGYFREKYGKKKVINSINKRIRKYGFWSVVISRTVYIIPTNVINFSFPLSSISKQKYFLGTIIGLIPECFINVFSGNLLKNEVILLSSPEGRTWKALVIGGFLLVLTISFILLRIRQQRIKKFKRLKAVPPLQN